MLKEVLKQNLEAVSPLPDAPNPMVYAQESASTRTRTTPSPPSLLDKVLQELVACLDSLRVAEEAIRVQNRVLKKYDLARRAERRRYLNLFTSVPVALLVTDAYGLILEANPAAALLLRGIAPRGGPRLIIGSPATKFVAQDERAVLLGVLQAAGGGTAWEGCLWLQPRRGAVFRASVTVTPVPEAGNTSSALRWLIRAV